MRSQGRNVAKINITKFQLLAFEKPGPGNNRHIGRELHWQEATSRKAEISLQLAYAAASSCPSRSAWNYR